jgi:hypothetical protein
MFDHSVTMVRAELDWVARFLIDLPALDKIRMEHYHEGLSVQILHIGSYEQEGPVLARLHKGWIPKHGYVENGRHHEIYLSDARRVDASKLKTVLRQPIRKV